MGTFENLNRPTDYIDHRKSVTIITTNIIAAIRNTLKPAHSFNDDNTDKASRNTLATMNCYPLSKTQYAVDIAFKRE